MKENKTSSIISTINHAEGTVTTELQGELSYDDAMIIGANIQLNCANAFVDSVPEDTRENVRLTVYDDMSLRATQLLSLFIPDSELPTDFTEEAQQALADEDEYIDLKFKALQYEATLALLKDDKKISVGPKGEIIEA